MRHLSVPCLLGLLLGILLTSPLKAQPVPPAEADSLLQLLTVGQPDTNRVNIWLRLGEYHVYKTGEFKADLDSASAYAKQAEGLSRSLGFEKGFEGSQRLLMQILIESKRMDKIQALLRRSKANQTKVNLLLQVGRHYLNKPEELKPDLDSAYLFIRQGEALSVSLRYSAGYEYSQLLLGHLYIESKQIDKLNAWLRTTKSNKAKASVVLRLGVVYLYKPGELKADLDSAETYLRQALDLNTQLKDEAKQIESLMRLGHVYSEKGNRVQAAIYYRQAIPLIEQIKNPLQRAQLWYGLGDAYTRSEVEMPEKIKAYEQALTLYRQLGDKEQEALTLKAIADMHQVQGKYGQSLRELLEVLRIQKAIGYRYLHYTYDLLGHVHKVMGNYEQALPYVLDAIKSAKASADTNHIDLFYYRLGCVYQNLGQHEQALEVFQHMVRKKREINYYFYYMDIIRSFLALNRTKEALTFQRQIRHLYPPEDANDKALMVIHPRRDIHGYERLSHA